MWQMGQEYTPSNSTARTFLLNNSNLLFYQISRSVLHSGGVNVAFLNFHILKNLRTSCSVCAKSWIYLVQYLSRPFEQRLTHHTFPPSSEILPLKSAELSARLPRRMAVHHASWNRAFCAYEVSVSSMIEKTSQQTSPGSFYISC